MRKRFFLSDDEGTISCQISNVHLEIGDWSTQEFIPHAEITSITALVEENCRSPTAVGMSKKCCGLCNAFIQGVNDILRLENQTLTTAKHCDTYKSSLFSYASLEPPIYKAINTSIHCARSNCLRDDMITHGDAKRIHDPFAVALIGREDTSPGELEPFPH
jgi:hypothetical protein